MIPPIVVTTISASLLSLIPKAISDAYDYFFNDEVIQVKKKADKTVLTKQNYIDARKAYAVYKKPNSMYSSQKQLTATLNEWFGTTKSAPQMMRICRSRP